MANIEQILLMGSPHGPDYARIALGGSAATVAWFERLSWEDKATGLGWIPKELRAPLCIKANPDEVSAGEMAAFCWALLTLLQRYEERRGKTSLKPLSQVQWHTPGERAVHRAAEKAYARQCAIIRTAIAEFQDSRICPTCKGGGQVKVPVETFVEGRGNIQVVQPITCPKCGGQGWRAWSDNRRAKAIGGDRNAYATQIAPAYLHVLNACTEQYRRGAQAFKAALFGPEQDHAIEARLQARA